LNQFNPIRVNKPSRILSLFSDFQAFEIKEKTLGPRNFITPEINFLFINALTSLLENVLLLT